MQIRKRRHGVPLATATAAEAAKVARLKDHMIEKRGAVDHTTASYVQAALDYGVELTRSEYRPLANRNWRIIQKFGVQLVRMLAVGAIALAILGAISYKTINDIQAGRRHGVIERCHAGEHFRDKLRAEVAAAPASRRVEAEASLKPTEELGATLAPITHADCQRALKAAGL